MLVFEDEGFDFIDSFFGVPEAGIGENEIAIDLVLEMCLTPQSQDHVHFIVEGGLGLVYLAFLFEPCLHLI